MTSNARPADALRHDDAPPTAPTSAGMKKVGGVAGWIDDRTGAAKGIGYLMKKVFPDHWSFMLGEIAMYSMIVCMLTGVFLTFWFDPSMAHTTYQGSYVPMQGVEMSRAYASTLDISFDVKGGLLIRQIHHWSALLFIAALSVHMLRVFFTGAFRKPREINWVIGCVLSLLALLEGFAGYSLPDDLLSGTGLRAAQGFMVSAPVIGSYLSYALFGGTFPGTDIIPRLYSIHILLLPALLIGLFTVHIVLVALQKHTQYPGPGKTNDNVVGFPVMPVYAAKAGGFFFIVFGGIALISSLIQINAVWVHGPYEPNATTAGAQPDWYMLFPDGALRLLPGFLEFETFGFTWAFPVIIGALLVIPAFYGGMIAYPFIEAWITGDKREHHLLDRPRNVPTRTGLGVAAVTLYAVLTFAAANDIMAVQFGMSINDITWTLRVLTFLGPLLAFWATRRLCLSLQRHERDLVLHGRETGRIERSADGEFHEVHEPLDPYTRWTLVQHEGTPPLQLEPAVDENGVENKKGARKNKLRAKLHDFYFGGAVEPVSPAELEAAHHGHDHEQIEAAEHDKVTTR
ncbi:cytochrome bc complex cytochrome b subunit [Janibacter sp. DB-40]|uniref:cytochrome bc1 complex cytochrome b subunit n=1 Tax=Janibacter sp. DB-40 TaxID=3028808 RepID=UPI002404FC93|nr:cytochrome bc complex cytochrome b subunit [Janibacter sp. DB-40]